METSVNEAPPSPDTFLTSSAKSFQPVGNLERLTTLDLRETKADAHGRVVTFHLISVPKALRHQGVGESVLTQVCAWADEHRITLTGTADSAFGTPLSALLALYRRHGFVGERHVTRRPL